MAMSCAINGCGGPADTIDDMSGLPMCWDCNDEITAMRDGQGVSLRQVAQDAFGLGLWGGIFSHLGR